MYSPLLRVACLYVGVLDRMVGIGKDLYVGRLCCIVVPLSIVGVFYSMCVLFVYGFVLSIVVVFVLSSSACRFLFVVTVFGCWKRFCICWVGLLWSVYSCCVCTLLFCVSLSFDWTCEELFICSLVSVFFCVLCEEVVCMVSVEVFRIYTLWFIWLRWVFWRLSSYRRREYFLLGL